MPADFGGRQAVSEGITARTMLGRAATLEDVGDAAVFAASDLARAMTATALTLTCGATVDQRLRPGGLSPVSCPI